jgi:hypothetical protein
MCTSGDRPYVSDSATSAHLVDANGARYAVDARITSIPAGRVFPEVGIRIAPGKRKVGYFVFDVPVHARVKQVQLALGLARHDVTRWRVSD